MSAWIVTRAHIDVLVLAGVQLRVAYDRTAAGPSPVLLAAAGAELWAVNVESVDYRYGECTEPSPYPAPTAEVILDPVAVVKAIDCYVYQSGEHPGWEVSAAADYCQRLRAAAMVGLPLASDDGRYPAGWDEAPWGVDHLAQAAASTSRAARGTR